MSPRATVVRFPARARFALRRTGDAAARALVIVPAHDEAPNLPSVLADLHASCPDVPVLVIDDGSRDGTSQVAEAAGAAWLRFDARLGVGSAVTAGLRYAVRYGIDRVVRVDGDGQHDAADAAAMLRALDDGEADAILGTRYSQGRPREGPVGRRLAQHLLARLLSWMTRERVSDPTCGCAAFGPQALELLAEHHPSGYPEPELRLLLHRHGLRVVEHAIASRPRRSGRSTLTTARLWCAAARVALAVLVVPFRELRDAPEGSEVTGRVSASPSSRSAADRVWR